VAAALFPSLAAARRSRAWRAAARALLALFACAVVVVPGAGETANLLARQKRYSVA